MQGALNFNHFPISIESYHVKGHTAAGVVGPLSCTMGRSATADTKLTSTGRLMLSCSTESISTICMNGVRAISIDRPLPNRETGRTLQRDEPQRAGEQRLVITVHDSVSDLHVGVLGDARCDSGRYLLAKPVRSHRKAIEQPPLPETSQVSATTRKRGPRCRFARP